MIPLLLGMAAEDLKEGRLTVLANGEKVVNFGNTNSDCGSDAAAIITRALRDGDTYIING